jgi:D-glycero-D-manno-heptose 1,7-bisphosphate phosphatase
MKTIIMAGGRGTRISSVISDVPKPMIKICGKPVLEHEVECLRNQGFTDIILTVSYMQSAIIDYFGDGSKISPSTNLPFGVKIEYFIEEKPLGNAGALFQLKDKLKDDFLLLNADSIFDVDFQKFVSFHKGREAVATLFTHPNSHPYDSGLIVADENGIVKRWLTKEEDRSGYFKNRVNAGLHVISPKIFELVKPGKDTENMKVDLDRQLLIPLVGTGQMYCYDSSEYVKDMGTPERYETVLKEFESGVVSAKNLRNRQKAIFLDRDGTINKYVGFLRDIEQFELISGVGEGIKAINHSGYLAIVVTNQPVIARGEITVGELEQIHNKMDTLLGQKEAFLDAIYYCPHHPHRGYEGEVTELKIDCGCRKPKPGMLLKAAKDFNIDLSSSWMVGDGECDIYAGKAAGCRTVLIGRGDYGQDKAVNTFAEAIGFIMEGENS